MTRQNIKYLICLAFNLVGILLTYLFVDGIINYTTFFYAFFIKCLLLVSYLIIFVETIDTSKKSKNIRMIYTFYYPKLPKKVLHESGEYYIKYINDDINKDGIYEIFIDDYFKLSTIFRIEDCYIQDSEDLLRRVKEKLDEMYRSKMVKIKRLNQKEDALKNWDGYTSIREKRDDKIKQLTS